MVGPGHSPMISKYGLSLSKAVGPVDPSFLVVKKSHFNKKYSSYSESTNSTKQKVHVSSQYCKICLKQPLKIKLEDLKGSPDLLNHSLLGLNFSQVIPLKQL